jgi:sugar fermentation stimulation protein A
MAGTARIYRPDQGGLRFPRLVRGLLVARFQRFSAHVRLGNHHLVTAHCPNTGSMLGCCEPGRPVFLSRRDDPGRRLKYTWELIQMPDSLVGINTAVPNLLVKTAIMAGRIETLSGYQQVRAEIPVGSGTRLDLLLEDKRGGRCYIEIKNCTLVEDGAACFPDAVTTRGQRHLKELARLARNGHRAVIFFLVQREDARCFRPADRIDPTYGRLLREALRFGVEVLVYDVHFGPGRIDLNRFLPFHL